MKSVCPVCCRQIRHQDERRYVTAKYTPIYNVGYAVLYKFSCGGRRGCKHEYLYRVCVPLDGTLAVEEGYYHNWEAWKRAEKTRPGQAPLKTTSGEYSIMASLSPEYVYLRILGRGKPNADCFIAL